MRRSQRPIVLAHRGFSGPGAHELENSAEAFARAAALGCEWVETDVHATADGVVVAFHDDVLDRVTSHSGRITELTWAEVSTARIGGSQPIPRLDELFTRFDRLKFNIDVKSSGAVEPLAHLINELGVHDRVRIASFSDRRRLATTARLNRPVLASPGQALTAALWAISRGGPRLAPVFARAARGVDCLQVPRRFGSVEVVDSRLIETAHAAGVEIHVWTINEPAEMVTLLNLGVDALVTDRADLALDLIAERAADHG